MPKSKDKVSCLWCFREANLIDILIPASPILEWMEKIINKIENEGISNLTPEEEWEVLIYDEMVNTVIQGSVCSKCWENNNKLYKKYYTE